MIVLYNMNLNHLFSRKLTLEGCYLWCAACTRIWLTVAPMAPRIRWRGHQNVMELSKNVKPALLLDTRCRKTILISYSKRRELQQHKSIYLIYIISWIQDEKWGSDVWKCELWEETLHRQGSSNLIIGSLLKFWLVSWRWTKNPKNIYQVCIVCWIQTVHVQILMNSLQESSWFQNIIIRCSQIQLDKETVVTNLQGE